MGLVIGTMVLKLPEFRSMIPQDKPDLMIPIFIREYLPHGIIGILMVAIFSAAMSSLSSTINSLSAATTEDLFNRDKSLPTDKYMRYSKIAAIFWGVFCIIFAFFTGDIADTVIEAINKIGSVFYGPILATFICATALKRTNSIGINAGIIAGVLVNVYLWLFCPQIFWFWWNAIGAIVTTVVAVLVSMMVSSEVKSIELESSENEVPTSYVVALLGFFVLIVLISVSVPSLF